MLLRLNRKKLICSELSELHLPVSFFFDKLRIIVVIWVSFVKDNTLQAGFAVLFRLLVPWWMSKAFGGSGGVTGSASGQAVFSSPTICYFSLWREAPEKGNSLQFNGAF